MDRKIQPLHRVWRIVRATLLAQLCCFTFLIGQNIALEGRGGFGGGRGGGRGFRFPTPEESFSDLDANGDGRLSSEEIESNGFTSRMLQNQNVDTSRGLSRDEFLNEMQRIRESFRNRGG